MSQKNQQQPNRQRLVLFVAQGHLEPGMSLALWRDILDRRLGAKSRNIDLAGLPEATLTAIADDITAHLPTSPRSGGTEGGAQENRQ